jgi:hypothetical protein
MVIHAVASAMRCRHYDAPAKVSCEELCALETHALKFVRGAGGWRGSSRCLHKAQRRPTRQHYILVGSSYAEVPILYELFLDSVVQLDNTFTNSIPRYLQGVGVTLDPRSCSTET